MARHGGIRARETQAAEPLGLAGAEAASEDPRVVTTGGKVLTNVDSETGEELAFYATGSGGFRVTRQMNASPGAPPGIALIDALAFTVVPPDEESMRWVLREMQRFLPIEDLESRGGSFGFKQSVRFGEGAGIIAWGGASQRDRVYFSILGKGCSMIPDWAGLAEWLQERVDGDDDQDSPRWRAAHRRRPSQWQRAPGDFVLQVARDAPQSLDVPVSRRQDAG
jgi:hypothetical protein